MEIQIRQTDPTFLGVDTNLDSIQVFCVDIDAIYDPSESCYPDILSKDEMNKADRFFHIRDRASFLVRKYCLRVLLSKITSRKPSDLLFNTIANRKPVIEGQEFNASHSGKYAMIAISSAPVGIDIEEIDQTFDFEGVVKRCFTKDEQKALECHEDKQNFFRLWTRKEATLKASGEGLTNDLHLLNCVPNRILRNGRYYELTTFYPETNYVVTIASELNTSKILFWKISPEIQEQTAGN